MKKLWNRLRSSTDGYLFNKVKSMEPGLLIFLVIKTTLGIAMPLLSVLLLQRIVDGLLEGTPLNSLLFMPQPFFWQEL